MRYHVGWDEFLSPHASRIGVMNNISLEKKKKNWWKLGQIGENWDDTIFHWITQIFSLDLLLLSLKGYSRFFLSWGP